MQKGRSQDRSYPAVLIGFLVALVAAGLLGVPALLVVAGGAAVATLAILAFRGRLEGARVARPRPPRPSRPIARQYVPSVLEGSSARHRRGARLHRRRRPGQPVRFR